MHKIEVKGGVISPGELKDILNLAAQLELSYLHFGSRQDILFSEKNANGEPIDKHSEFTEKEHFFSNHQNITSSYVTTDIFKGTHWLRGSTYLYVLEDFNYPSQLKINIVDPRQQLVPLFSGHLNFIASEIEDYWYLYLKLPQGEHGFYPVLLFTWDLAKIAVEIENTYKAKKYDINDLFQLLNDNLATNNRIISEELQIKSSPFPYYEGMNKMEKGQYWLGLYWRNNQYDVQFLDQLCDFSIVHKIGKICITPWKSLIVKNIPALAKSELERLLGSSGINIRHSSLELNWHLPVNDQKALKLKKFLVADFDNRDISTYGITFSIVNETSSKNFFTSIVIKNSQSELEKIHQLASSYTIWYAKNFNPNSREYLVYAQDIDKEHLSSVLIELTKAYFSQLSEDKTSKKYKPVQNEDLLSKDRYQCIHCKSIYDEDLGDPFQDISKNTTFESLPDTYVCNLCESPKDQFKKTPLNFVK